jgi:hypothetical protein
MSKHSEAIRKRSEDFLAEQNRQVAPVVSLCAHRQSRTSAEHRLTAGIRQPAIAAHAAAHAAARAAQVTIAAAGAGILLLLWPLAKLAGVLAWSDADERE